MRLTIAVITGVVLTTVGPVAATTQFTPVFGAAWSIAPPSGAALECIGGAPTGGWPPCSPGARARIRGSNLTYYQALAGTDGTALPRLTGVRTALFNANLDAAGRGHIWGTWTVWLDGGLGTWEGTFTGTATGWFDAAAATAVGAGTSGSVAGRQVRLSISYEHFPVDPNTGAPGVETITGYDFQPKGGVAAAKTAGVEETTVINPTVVGPIPALVPPGDPAHEYPFFATTADLSRHDYVEEEYFFEGWANRYTIAAPFETATVLDGGHPYRTRMVVRRPASPQRFNGTVLMEWQNVTAGYDLDALWAAMSDHLIRRGYAWVGVSAQRVGVHHPVAGLRAWSPGRYGALDVTAGGTITNDALQYDIFSQAGQAVRHPMGVDPMAGLRVTQVLAAGASQGAGRLVRYHNAIHPLAGVFDGFLLVVGGPQLRTDLTTKVFKVLSETDVVGTAVTTAQASIRQPDTDHYRTWEVAGAAHLDFQVVQAIAPLQARDGLAGTPASCALPPFSRIPFAFAGNAALDHLVDWVRYDLEPPTAPGIEIAVMGSPAVAARDSRGNALGGIQLSQHAIATATNTGVNLPVASFCRIFGSHEPFDSATLASLYPTHGVYVTAVTQHTRANLARGYLVVEDAQSTIREAALSEIK